MQRCRAHLPPSEARGRAAHAAPPQHRVARAAEACGTAARSASARRGASTSQRARLPLRAAAARDGGGGGSGGSGGGGERISSGCGDDAPDAAIQREVSSAVARLGSRDADEQAAGLRVLFDLAERALCNNRDMCDFQTALVAAGGIPPFVRMLGPRYGMRERVCAAGVLICLCQFCPVALRRALVDAGVVPRLMALVMSASIPAETQAVVVSALRSLTTADDTADAEIVRAGGIPRFVFFLHSPLDALRAASAAMLSGLSEQQGAAFAAAAAGAIPQLIVMLKAVPTDGVLEAERAADVLRNISAPVEGAAAVVAAGGVPPLVALLSSPEVTTQEAAARTLRNICDCEAGVSAISGAGGVIPLARLLQSPSTLLRARSAEMLARLSVRMEDACTIAVAGGIPGVIALLSSTYVRVGVKESAACVLHNMSMHDACANAVAAAGGIHLLIALLGSQTVVLQTHAAAALASLSANDAFAAQIVEASGLAPLARLAAESNSTAVQEYARAALGNMHK